MAGRRTAANLFGPFGRAPPAPPGPATASCPDDSPETSRTFLSPAAPPGAQPLHQPVMARVCQSTGKRTTVGGSISRRGLPKKTGGIGLNITGHTKRKFKPNIQKVKVLTNDGKTATRKKVCTRCLKAGKVVKR